MTRLLVCGGRDFFNKPLLVEVLSEYLDPVIICGYDPIRSYPSGADQMAYAYAMERKLACWTFPYHYHLGKAGGNARNAYMLERSAPDLVIAFPTPASRGTWNMVMLAKNANIERLIVR